MGYDIGRFESRKYADAGVDFPLTHPREGEVKDGDGKPVTIKLGGVDSPRIRAAVKERREQKRKDAEAAKDAAPVVDPVADAIDDLVTMTCGWSENLELDGKPYPFNPDNARALYQRFPEIFEQMAWNAGQRANFMLASSKN